VAARGAGDGGGAGDGDGGSAGEGRGVALDDAAGDTLHSGSLSTSGPKSRPAKVGSVIVKIKLRGEHGGIGPERPLLGPFLSAMRSRLERDGRRAAELEREVEAVRRELRNFNDRRRLEAQVKEQQLKAKAVSKENERQDAVRKRAHAQREASTVTLQRDQARAEAKVQRKRVAALASSNGALEKNNTKLALAVAGVEERLQKRACVVTELDQERTTLRDHAHSLEEENLTLHSKASEAQAAASVAKAEAAAAREQAATAVAELEAELEQMRA